MFKVIIVMFNFLNIFDCFFYDFDIVVVVIKLIIANWWFENDKENDFTLIIIMRYDKFWVEFLNVFQIFETENGLNNIKHKN